MIAVVLALYWSGTTEYRQTREDGPVATGATLPFGVMASLLLTFGLMLLRVDPPWWGVVIVFPGTVLLFPAIIYAVGRRPPQD